MLDEPPGIYTKTQAMVTFTEKNDQVQEKGGVVPGSMKGKLTITVDFDEPLPELGEYMNMGLCKY